MSSADYEQRLKTGRNDTCPCGSGKKYKKCHLAEDEGARSAALKALEEEAKARAAAKAAEEEAEAEAGSAEKGAAEKTEKTTANKAKSKAKPSKNDKSATKPRGGGQKAKNMPRRKTV